MAKLFFTLIASTVAMLCAALPYGLGALMQTGLSPMAQLSLILVLFIASLLTLRYSFAVHAKVNGAYRVSYHLSYLAAVALAAAALGAGFVSTTSIATLLSLSVCILIGLTVNTPSCLILFEVALTRYTAKQARSKAMKFVAAEEARLTEAGTVLRSYENLARAGKTPSTQLKKRLYKLALEVHQLTLTEPVPLSKQQLETLCTQERALVQANAYFLHEDDRARVRVLKQTFRIAKEILEHVAENTW